jgi:non-ribosomal peptide synthetase component F
MSSAAPRADRSTSRSRRHAPADGGNRHQRAPESEDLTMPVVSYPCRLADLAAQQPDRPAVICGDRSISRAGLEAGADRLARDLRHRGVGVGDMVTIALPNSLEAGPGTGSRPGRTSAER